MEQKNSRQFFLGANTGAGFVSLYSAFAAPEDGAFVWYIKGGPGNGKSTLMRRAAERASNGSIKSLRSLQTAIHGATSSRIYICLLYTSPSPRDA